MNAELLRDIFAAIALLSFLQDHVDAPPQDICDDAYYIADLMMQARNKRDWTVGDKS